MSNVVPYRGVKRVHCKDGRIMFRAKGIILLKRFAQSDSLADQHIAALECARLLNEKHHAFGKSLLNPEIDFEDCNTRIRRVYKTGGRFKDLPYWYWNLECEINRSNLERFRWNLPGFERETLALCENQGLIDFGGALQFASMEIKSLKNELESLNDKHDCVRAAIKGARAEVKSMLDKMKFMDNANEKASLAEEIIMRQKDIAPLQSEFKSLELFDMPFLEQKIAKWQTTMEDVQEIVSDNDYRFSLKDHIRTVRKMLSGFSLPIEEAIASFVWADGKDFPATSSKKRNSQNENQSKKKQKLKHIF